MAKNSYLDFLQYCVAKGTKLPASVGNIKWDVMLELATQQAIVGIVYDGIQRAGKSISMPFDLLMEWICYAQQIETQNKIALQRLETLLGYLDKSGLKGCLLKGLGAASYYPKPLLRQAGDLDVWVDGERKDIVEFVRLYNDDSKISLHHIDLNVFDDQPVEIHFIPTYLISPIRNKRMQNFFLQEKEAQFQHYSTLGEGRLKVCVPTTAFNLVFMMGHMYRHFLYEGLGLRQVIDYYYVMQAATSAEKEQARIEIRRMGMGKFCKGIMWMMRELFKFDGDSLMMPANENEGRYVAKRIFNAGNFGANHHFCGHFSKKWYNLKIQAHYPEELMWNLPHSIFYRYKVWKA